MKRKSIIVLAVLSFYAGIANNLRAQDSTQSLFKYIINSPWNIGVGLGFSANNSSRNPFQFDVKNKKHFYPGIAFVEKGLYDFRKKNYLKGVSLQFVVGREGWNPTHFLSLDANIKYNVSVLWKEQPKWLEPYLILGTGFSSMRYRKFDNTAKSDWHDRFQTINGGLGANLWIFPNVALNLSCVGKWEIVGSYIDKGPQEGTNYYAYTGGLVFKIGGCKKEAAEVEEVKQPVSNYKRTKEEEDALIHLREHINQ